MDGWKSGGRGPPGPVVELRLPLAGCAVTLVCALSTRNKPSVQSHFMALKVERVGDDPEGRGWTDTWRVDWLMISMSMTLQAEAQL